MSILSVGDNVTFETSESPLSIEKVGLEDDSPGPIIAEANAPCSPNDSASAVSTPAPASPYTFSANVTGTKDTELVYSSTLQAHSLSNSESSIRLYDSNSSDELPGIDSGHDTTDEELNITIPDNHSNFSDIDYEHSADVASSLPSAEAKSPSELNRDSSNLNHEDDGSINRLIEPMRLDSNPDKSANEKTTERSRSHYDSSGPVQINESLVSILPDGDDPCLEHPSSVHPSGVQTDETLPVITVKREYFYDCPTYFY